MLHHAHPVQGRAPIDVNRQSRNYCHVPGESRFRAAFRVAALLLLALGSRVIAQDQPIYGPNGHGVWRHGSDDSPGKAPNDCQKEKQDLLDQCAALSQVMNEPAYRDNAKLQSVFRNEMLSLVKQWHALEARCPEVTGRFPFLDDNNPTVPAGPPAPPNDPPIESDPLGNGILAAGTDFGLGAVSGAGEGLAEEGISSIGSLVDTLSGDGANIGQVVKAVGQSAISEGATEGVVSVVVDNTVDTTVDTATEIYNGGKEGSGDSGPKPEMMHTGKEMVTSRYKEKDALLGVVMANQRYRAAAAAGDALTMQKELQNAVDSAQQAKSESRKAMLAHHEIEMAAQTSTDQAIGVLEKKGIKLSDALAQWQQSVKLSGLPAKLISQLQTAGLSPQQIDQIRQGIVNSTPTQLQAALEARRDRLTATEAVREKLLAAKSDATWPEPVELGRITQFEMETRTALREVSQTRIDLAGPTGMALEKLPKWWAVPSGSALGASLDPAGLHQLPSSGPLMPGTYDIYASESLGTAGQPLPSAVRLAKGVVVVKGKPTTMPVNSGISLHLPKELAPPYSWFVLPSDSNSTIPLAARADGSADPLLLPDGKYDVYWVQTQSQLGRPMLVAAGIDVKPGTMTAVPVPSSSITLDVAGWVPPRDASYGWWGLVRSGDPPQYAIQCAAKTTSISVPPGVYDLYWKQDYDHDPFLIAGAIKADENIVSTVAADSGILIEVADWVPARDASYGRWGAVRAGQQPPIKTFINWSTKDDKLLLPPGAYDIYWVQDYYHDPFLLKAHVDASAARLVTIQADTGIQLKVPGAVPPMDKDYGFWGALPTGQAATIPTIRSVGRFDRPLLVPAGTYDIVWKQNYNEPIVVLKKGIVVPADAKSPLEVEVQPPSLASK